MVFAAILISYEYDYIDISQLWLVGLNLVFNVLMPLTLMYVLEKRRDISFKWIVLLCSVLVISCDTSSYQVALKDSRWRDKGDKEDKQARKCYV